MGSKHLKPTILLLAAVWWANLAMAQTTAPYLKEVLILNGGQYGNPQENVTLIGYDPFTGNVRVSDTIHTQSIQDLLIEGSFAYIAAQDSIVKIRLSDFSRVAATAFPGASTYTLATYYDQLLVGNWYGQTDSNLYVFDKDDLTLDYVVPQIEQGVKGIAIIGDTAYLAQNLTDASYSDSAGYLSLVYLPTGAFVKNVPGDGVSDIAKLHTYAGGVLGIGSATDMASFYDPANGSLIINPISVNVAGGYGSILQLEKDTLFGVYDDKLGSLNASNGSIIDADIVDTLIIAFAYDTVNQHFYVTQTDYFSYTRGIVFDKTGTAIDTFQVGFAPEAVKLVYGVNTAPVAANDTLDVIAAASLSIFPLLNDTDSDGDSLVLSIITPPYDGTATLNGSEILYQANTGGYITDSLQYQVCDLTGGSLCSEAWVYINVLGVGIDEINSHAVTVYPNPTTDKLTIRLGGSQNQTMYLTDLAGRTVQTIEVKGNATVDIRSLPTGLYFLRGTEGMVSKVVKQ